MTHDHIRINGCYQCVLPNVTDEIEPLNMHGHANTWEEELQEVCAERDALRAEVERLGIDMRAWKIRAETAEAENERLKQAIEQTWRSTVLLLTRSDRVDELAGQKAELQREKQAMLEQMDIQLHMNRLVANRVIEHNADTCQHKDCSGA